MRLDADGVFSDGQQGDEIMSGVVGRRFAGNVCGLRNDAYLRSCDDRAGIIGDRAGETSCRLTKQQGADRKQD